ncbi:MAG: Cysteine desulfurase [Chlamydiae bacterium]|nr:Cysteine desulfurase [Chlamydiota bacterium]
MTLLKQVRKDFPILQQRIHGKPLIYFDAAATTQKPKQVIDAITNFYSHQYGTVHRGVYRLAAGATDAYNEVREKVALFINAPSHEQIVFTRGTTDSINLVAQSYGRLLRPGDEILITEMEHHSNFVPWQLLAKERGLILKVAPINEKAEIDLEAFSALLTPATKLVSIAHIANSTGTLNPIETITEMAQGVGAKVLIDAAQSAAHLPIDVAALDVDFLAFSSHKAYGPTGVGILYGKKELLEMMPPIQGGGDMIERVSIDGTTFQEPPLKFEAGTPSIAQVIGFGAAIDYIQGLGLERIAAWEGELLAVMTKKLEAFPGMRIIGTSEKKGPIVSFVIEGVHHLDLATLLDLEGIAIRSGHHCAQPLLERFSLTGTNRVSFSPFNTLEEIDVFMDALKGCLEQLGSRTNL